MLNISMLLKIKNSVLAWKEKNELSSNPIAQLLIPLTKYTKRNFKKKSLYGSLISRLCPRANKHCLESLKDEQYKNWDG